ncbi:MAG: hypothetical protein LBL98_06305 [Ruminococcus sp.]|jgi:hypothetical protein|nr:hypothetical protein [Ruminococcus sp.]
MDSKVLEELKNAKTAEEIVGIFKANGREITLDAAAAAIKRREEIKAAAEEVSGGNPYDGNFTLEDFWRYFDSFM